MEKLTSASKLKREETPACLDYATAAARVEKPGSPENTYPHVYRPVLDGEEYGLMGNSRVPKGGCD